MAQQIVVVPHDPAWGRAFAAEARVIRAVLGENCLAVYHIGSTAAEGLWAKPILDILPVVRDLEAVDNRRDALTALGYEYLGEFGIPSDDVTFEVVRLDGDRLVLRAGDTTLYFRAF